MPRPRFDRLPEEQQQDIIRAALDEFAAHGFNAGSLNRIIDEAGISKGSMYYYFDGKGDLYAHVVRVELGRLTERAGPFPVPAARDASEFWSELEGHCLKLVRGLVASPKLAALARDWLTAPASPDLRYVRRELEQAALPWLEQALAAGMRAGAVRKDAPMGLLLAVVFGMGQAMDAWLVTQKIEPTTLRKHTRLLIGMMRRALSP